MPVPKGTRFGGRQKGSGNKIPGDIKAMILKALDDEGGAKYLRKQASANPVAFMGLIGKVLPMTVAGDPDKPLFPNRIEIKVVHAQR